MVINIREYFHLQDEFGDNKYEDRVDRIRFHIEKGASLGSVGNIRDMKDRPEWTVQSGTWSAADGYLKIASTKKGWQHITTPSTRTEGTWECDVKLPDPVGDSSHRLNFMADNTNLDKSYLINWHDTDYYRLVKGISGVGTNLIDVAKKRDPIKHRLKATRDASGNFELFFDGKSEGTATDTELKTGNYLAVRGYEIGESTDNIKVY